MLNSDIQLGFNSTLPFLAGQRCGPNNNLNGGYGCNNKFGNAKPPTYDQVYKICYYYDYYYIIF